MALRGLRAHRARVRQPQHVHSPGPFYEVFPPSRARELVRRIGDLGIPGDEIASSSIYVNGVQRGIDWQMKSNDARCKLKSIYPNIRV